MNINDEDLEAFKYILKALIRLSAADRRARECPVSHFVFNTTLDPLGYCSKCGALLELVTE